MARFFVMRKEKQILSSAQDDSHSERSEESASGCGLGPRCEKITTGAQSPVLYSTGQRHTQVISFQTRYPACAKASAGGLGASVV